MRVFGDRFLGYDNGEQDGRYIGAYADRGPHTNRKEGWEDFVRWDTTICNDHLNYMNATGSLNYSHYYGERGARMLGLETAQGLPSDTLMFAFLRGAGKQYGRLTCRPLHLEPLRLQHTTGGRPRAPTAMASAPTRLPSATTPSSLATWAGTAFSALRPPSSPATV